MDYKFQKRVFSDYRTAKHFLGWNVAMQMLLVILWTVEMALIVVNVVQLIRHKRFSWERYFNAIVDTRQLAIRYYYVKDISNDYGKQMSRIEHEWWLIKCLQLQMYGKQEHSSLLRSRIRIYFYRTKHALIYFPVSEYT